MKRSLPWMDMVLYPLVAAVAIWLGPRNALWYAGLGFSLVCAALWFLALRQLGSSFALLAEARSLVTGGLYAKIRHPVYVFGDSAYLGALLALQSWPSLLAEALAEDYEQYKRGTWF